MNNYRRNTTLTGGGSLVGYGASVLVTFILGILFGGSR